MIHETNARVIATYIHISIYLQAIRKHSKRPSFTRNRVSDAVMVPCSVHDAEWARTRCLLGAILESVVGAYNGARDGALLYDPDRLAVPGAA